MHRPPTTAPYVRFETDTQTAFVCCERVSWIFVTLVFVGRFTKQEQRRSWRRCECRRRHSKHHQREQRHAHCHHTTASRSQSPRRRYEHSINCLLTRPTNSHGSTVHAHTIGEGEVGRLGVGRRIALARSSHLFVAMLANLIGHGDHPPAPAMDDM